MFSDDSALQQDLWKIGQEGSASQIVSNLPVLFMECMAGSGMVAIYVQRIYEQAINLKQDG